jgi:hypothetical protein
MSKEGDACVVCACAVGGDPGRHQVVWGKKAFGVQ